MASIARQKKSRVTNTEIKRTMQHKKSRPDEKRKRLLTLRVVGGVEAKG
jgi:hypothetical protein